MNNITNWTDRIDTAVGIREEGNSYRALHDLRQVRTEALAAENNDIAASATGHIILCYKHLYQETRQSDFLRMMEREVETGLDLEVDDDTKSLFYLRQGDVHQLQERYPEMETAYKKALQMVYSGSRQEIEYLGHYGEAKSLNGKHAEAVQIIQKALQQMKELHDSRIPKWHEKIIVSGLYARLIRAALGAKKPWLALTSFVRGYRIACELAKNHDYPIRKQQYERAVREKLGR